MPCLESGMLARNRLLQQQEGTQIAPDSETSRLHMGIVVKGLSCAMRVQVHLKISVRSDWLLQIQSPSPISNMEGILTIYFRGYIYCSCNRACECERTIVIIARRWPKLCTVRLLAL